VKRRWLIVPVGSAVMWPLTSSAQKAEKTYCIGVLEAASAALNGPDLKAFREGTREYGQAGGQTVSRIFKGAKPAELPVERPTRFDVVINLKTAEELGLNIPRAMQARADELIK
jgi:ABC-type uncharacterized transport system substrate-binding protein